MSRLAAPALVTLVAAAFVSQLGYAIAQPLLPFLLGRAGEGVNENTGLLTATYAGALVIFAPIWGRLSDLWSRRLTLLIGVGGLAIAMSILSYVGSLPALYAGLFLAGAFSGAIWPVALAIIADAETDEHRRARSFGHIYVAVTAGFLVGPAIGGLLGRMWIAGMPVTGMPFLVAAAAAAIVLLVAAWTVPRGKVRRLPPPEQRSFGRANLRSLILISLLASWGLGTFEVGLTLRAAQDFGLGPDMIGWLFVECMIVMILAQLVVFNRRVPPSTTRWLLAPSLALLGLALLLTAVASDWFVLLAAVAATAAALGAILPVIGYWVSLSAGNAQGAELGGQVAAAGLGQALGSAVAGLLFGLAWAESAFVVAMSVVVAGAALAVPLSRRLALLSPVKARGAAG